MKMWFTTSIQDTIKSFIYSLFCIKQAVLFHIAPHNIHAVSLCSPQKIMFHKNTHKYRISKWTLYNQNFTDSRPSHPYVGLS